MKIYAKTDVGRKREMNQDYVYVTDKPVGPFPNLLVVADGMGGHKAGDFVSKYTVKVVHEELEKTELDKPEEILKSIVSVANHKLIQAAQSDVKLEGMGTTLVIATVIGNTLYFSNVGDSRLYLIGDKIKQLSKDHSLVEEMVRLGGIKAEEAKNHPDKNIITRAMGVKEEVEADIYEYRLKKGDMILMCTDGLSNMVEDEDMFDIVKGARDIVEAVQMLIEKANSNGGSYVAIKVLKKEYREDENFVRKFHSEAQAAAGLLNPNIVNVYDVGEDRGLYYMVMELVEGITLKEYIEKKGKLSHKEVISIAIQMCNGIGAAHAAGIVHRDIKPQNVMISRDGKVKVTDFGIAKAVTSNTISSNAMGSVHYTSPEQARGGYSDAKSDIYSIGITLYEMVTGRVPFDGESTVEVAMKHLQQEITPPSEYAPDIPYSLEQIILKCTQKNSERRYASTADLTRDLKRSMMDPDGDFVEIPPLRNADTVIITDDELDDIRSSYDDYDDDYGDDDDYGADDYDDDYGDDRYDDDEEEYDDDDYDGRKGAEEVNPHMNKVMKILMIVVALIIAFILIFAVGKAAGIFKSIGSGTTTEDSSDKDTVKVPDIVGMTDAGFKPTSEFQYDDNVAEGNVISTTPAANSKAAKDTQVKMIVSKGAQKKTVPDVRGKSEADARSEIQAAGLTVGSTSTQHDDSVAKGNVISQSVTPGKKVSAGTAVNLVLSSGSDKVSIQNFAGKDEEELLSWASQNGLNASKQKDEYSSNYEEGTIISMSPASGSVSKGSTITYVLSRGPKPSDNTNTGGNTDNGNSGSGSGSDSGQQ